MANLSFWQRIAILIGLLIVGLLALLALDPIPQDPNYHLFADTRSLFGIPHFNNVISSAGFAVVGTLGILAFAGRRRHAIFAQRSDAWPYIVFFVGVALVSLGSAYYHWRHRTIGCFGTACPCQSRSWRSARRSSPTALMRRPATAGSCRY